MDVFELSVVIEVSKDKKVLCQYHDCGRSVYKRVHVVKINNDFKIYGSECYKKLFDIYPQLRTASPTYGSASGVLLTDEEREQLLQNTEELLNRFKCEQEAETELEQKQLEQKQLEQKQLEQKQKKLEQKHDYVTKIDNQLMSIALEQTKNDFRVNKGLNPELPGWAGWVKAEAKRLYEKLKAEKNG